ncbi:MAG: zf-HC2 domain-containing protein [Deltaproteobacteria bacterium]|nr:MAG: zf-HC2 domain-containing protein [Deltaproteobacteria bacterium]
MRGCEEVVPLLGPLHDGALADDDRAWVEDHVRGCASCRDRLALIVASAQAVRESVIARARGLDLTRLPDRVMARVREDRAAAAERAAVWGREMWWTHRRAFAAAGGLAVAACMAAAVLFLPWRRDDAALIADNSPQIEEVDFGTRNGAVLQLPRQTTVIWMSDDRAVSQ